MVAEGQTPFSAIMLVMSGHQGGPRQAGVGSADHWAACFKTKVSFAMSSLSSATHFDALLRSVSWMPRRSPKRVLHGHHRPVGSCQDVSILWENVWQHVQRHKCVETTLVCSCLLTV